MESSTGKLKDKIKRECEILIKIETYYKEKYKDLTDTEKKEIFDKMLSEAEIKEQFDNSVFFEALTEEECEIAKEIKYNEVAESLVSTFYPIGSGYMLKRLSIMFGKDKNDFNKEFANELKLYKDMLLTYKNVAEDLNLSSALELSYYCTYLLWNGYFSTTKYHEYDLNNRLLITEFLPLDIIRGGGVCLGYSDLLTDFLNICDKESVLTVCHVPRGAQKPSFNYRPDIERAYNKKSFFGLSNLFFCFASLINIDKRIGNHAVTAINENNQQYIFDVTNLCVLNINEEMEASLINGTGKYEIKKYALELLNTVGRRNELLKMIKEDKARSDLKRKDIIFGFENTVEELNENKSLLDSAYDEIHSNIVEIGSKAQIMKRRKW